MALDSLIQLRGIENLRLTGKDHILVDGKYVLVDINDSRAWGPYVRGSLEQKR